MKFPVALFALAFAPIVAAQTGQLTDTERTFLIDQLELTKKGFIDSLTGLSPEQWRFKAAPDRWSVAECAEHLVLAEDFIFQGSQGLLKTPAVPRPEKSNEQTDKMIVAMVADRSHKVSAPEPLVPKGHIETPADAIRAFTEKRDRNIAYVKTTKDDLRVHTGKTPAGDMDAYQLLLLMSAHSARHTAQIKEVQASPDYPKATASARLHQTAPQTRMAFD
jgi:DinB superfamily